MKGVTGAEGDVGMKEFIVFDGFVLHHSAHIQGLKSMKYQEELWNA